jgi:hypothetical protein
MSPEELEFWREVDALIDPPATTQIEYRLFYNVAGDIVKGTMIVEPTDEQYIVVPKNQYDQYFLYRVIDKKLKKIDNDPGYRVQLKKATTGFTVVRGHAGLLLEPGETYTDTEIYGHTNS